MEFRNDAAHEVPAPHFSTQIAREDVQALLQIVSNDDVNFEDIVRGLANRGVIAAVLVRTANSIGIGSVQQSRSLKHALAILGLQRIREILLDLRMTLDKDRSRIAS